MTVEREDTAVMFRPGEIPLVWDELEAAVGSLRGRKFFGVFDRGRRDEIDLRLPV